MRKYSTAYVFGMLGTDIATVGTVDMWLYRCAITVVVLSSVLVSAQAQLARLSCTSMACSWLSWQPSDRI